MLIRQQKVLMLSVQRLAYENKIDRNADNVDNLSDVDAVAGEALLVGDHWPFVSLWSLFAVFLVNCNNVSFA